MLKVGNWLVKEMGVKKGEVIALNGPNTAEYLMMWFAIDGICGVTGFINYNLTGEGLLHCVKISSTKCMLYDVDVSPAVEPVLDGMKKIGVGLDKWYDLHRS